MFQIPYYMVMTEWLVVFMLAALAIRAAKKVGMPDPFVLLCRTLHKGRTMIKQLSGRQRLGLFTTLCVVSGLTAGTVAYHSVPHYDPVRLEAWNKVTPRLRQTDAETRMAVNPSTVQVKQFFAERKKYARDFATEALSLSGKWEYVKGIVSDGSHERYLGECFERNIFRSEELRALIESAVSRYVSEIQGQENQLLVAIRADLEGSELTGPKYLPALGSEADFRREYEAMLERVIPILTKDMGISVGREVVSWVGGEIATKVLVEIGASLATKLGISGGILGAGAYSGVATFGVTLVAAILVDMALDFVIRQAGYDPEGAIAAKVIDSLDQLERLILDGDTKTKERYAEAMRNSTSSFFSSDRWSAWNEVQSIESGGGLGLTHQLNQINEVRSRLREEALKALILKGDVQ
jgi:hypothetical protein